MDSPSGKNSPAAKRDAAADAAAVKAEAKADASDAKAEVKTAAAEAKAEAKTAKEDAKAEAARADALPQVGDTVRLSDGSNVLVHSVMRKVHHDMVHVQAKGSHWRDARGATVLPQE